MIMRTAKKLLGVSMFSSVFESYNSNPSLLILEIKDKNQPEAEALAWLAVEKKETYDKCSDNTVNKASLNVTYQRLDRDTHHDKKGSFCAGYSRRTNTVSLTYSDPDSSSGAVFLDLPGFEGQRIGSYLMNVIVQWVQQWPEATVKSIKLASGQATHDNKKRRNRFYEQFGIVFNYIDEELSAGLSSPMLVKDLNTVDSWKQNIVEHNLILFLENMLTSKESLVSKIDGLEKSNEYFTKERNKAEAAPIRWAIKTLYNKYALLSIVLVPLILAGWFFIK